MGVWERENVPTANILAFTELLKEHYLSFSHFTQCARRNATTGFILLQFSFVFNKSIEDVLAMFNLSKIFSPHKIFKNKKFF